MKHLLMMLICTFMVLTLLSCEEDKKELSMVWGTLKAAVSPDSEILNGVTLGRSGADYQGYCRYTDKEFSFAIGDPEMGTDLRWEMYGIKGPPSDKPYLDDGTLRSDEDGSITKGQVWNQRGGWILNESNIIEEKCRVVLFAKAGSGDLTPKEFGKKKFQYVVKMDCYDGLDAIPSEYDSAGQELTGFRFELWFNHCE